MAVHRTLAAAGPDDLRLASIALADAARAASEAADALVVLCDRLRDTCADASALRGPVRPQVPASPAARVAPEWRLAASARAPRRRGEGAVGAAPRRRRGHVR